MSHYEQVLHELRNKTDKLGSDYIPKLYNILRDEKGLSPEECRTKIEHDCSDIWAEDTIRKYLPPEAKNAMKRKAGRISAEVKREKKKAKLLVANASDSGQFSALVDSENGNPVGINPTENGSIWQTEQGSSAFQEIADSQYLANVWTEDYYSALIAERLKDETFDLLEGLLIEGCISKSLFLPSSLAERVYMYINENRISGIISNFEVDHDGIRIVSVRTLDTKENHAETHDPSRRNKR
jgi:hypothetical protein